MGERIYFHFDWFVYSLMDYVVYNQEMAGWLID